MSSSIIQTMLKVVSCKRLRCANCSYRNRRTLWRRHVSNASVGGPHLRGPLELQLQVGGARRRGQLVARGDLEEEVAEAEVLGGGWRPRRHPQEDVLQAGQSGGAVLYYHVAGVQVVEGREVPVAQEEEGLEDLPAQTLHLCEFVGVVVKQERLEMVLRKGRQLNYEFTVCYAAISTNFNHIE